MRLNWQMIIIFLISFCSTKVESGVPLGDNARKRQQWPSIVNRCRFLIVVLCCLLPWCLGHFCLFIYGAFFRSAAYTHGGFYVTERWNRQQWPLRVHWTELDSMSHRLGSGSVPGSHLLIRTLRVSTTRKKRIHLMHIRPSTTKSLLQHTYNKQIIAWNYISVILPHSASGTISVNTDLFSEDNGISYVRLWQRLRLLDIKTKSELSTRQGTYLVLIQIRSLTITSSRKPS